MNNYINIEITSTGRLKQFNGADIYQYSSNNILRLKSKVYMDEVFCTFSVSSVRTHLVYKNIDEENNYIYECQLDPNNCTSAEVINDTLRITVSIYGYKKNISGFEEKIVSGQAPITLIKTNEEKQYDNSYNGVDIKNLNQQINKDRYLITELNKNINDLKDDIKDGTLVCKKAEQDKLGNDIYTTYETKSDMNSKVKQLTDLIASSDAVTLSSAKEYTDTEISNLSDDLNEKINKKVNTDDIIGDDATLVVKKAEQDENGNIIANVYGAKIALNYNNNDGNLRVSLLNSKGSIINYNDVSLPLEQVVVSGYYDEDTESLVLELNNGNKIVIPVSEIIDGLASETYVDDAIAEEKDYTDQLVNNLDNKITNLNETTISMEQAFDNLTQAIIDSNILGGE